MSDTFAQPTDLNGRLRVGDVVLNRSAQLVTVLGRTLPLPLQEYRLLTLLMEHADHIVPRTAILEQLWGPEFDGDPRTVTVHMLRLRKELERPPGASHHLRTVRSVGYIFDTEPVFESS